MYVKRLYTVRMEALRIGELARRTGVSPELLRAWERRYGVLRPSRTESGYRLYSEADAERVVRMQELLRSGLAAAEAARQAVEHVATDEPRGVADTARLADALLDFHDADANQAFDELLADFTSDAVLEQAVLPVLRELGERWARGEISVAQEHFASNLIRGRLLGLARGWDRGFGPRALLACLPEEQHDLGLLAFGLALRGHGWRITYVGADTPVETLARAAGAIAPAAVVAAVLDRARLEPHVAALAEVARLAPLWIGGAGADAELAQRAGARWLESGPVAAAAQVAGAAARAFR